MSIKSFIQILILLLIIIIGGVYLNILRLKKILLKKLNTSEIENKKKLIELEKKILELELKNKNLSK